MKMETAIRLLMKTKGISQENMSTMLGLKGANRVAGRLSNGNITINNALDMLDAMGYEITIKEKRGGRIRNDEIIVTREDEF